MSKKIASIRGMNDILPTDTPLWQWFENKVATLLQRYSYSEIRTPIVEQTDLFRRSIGEVTDIVEKEMYTFEDRNGDSLTLRPEGTASCVRAAEQHGLLYNQIQRLWYKGPMFRHERPQAGRYRQFHQIGVEAFGMATPDIDAELILLSRRLWQELGLEQQVVLQLNTLGSLEDRAKYRAALVEFLNQHRNDLDEDSQRRIERNPLRVLDSKNPQTQEILGDAPELVDYLSEESAAHFNQLKALLDAAGLSYEVNPRLVRGLDYYSHTVFEWVTDALGAQGTVCAGGRYDGLVEQLGGRATPAVGFAMGMERLILLLEQQALAINNAPHVYVVADDPQASILLAEQLRTDNPQLRVLTHCGGGSFKSQLRRADRSRAQVALIIGADEAASNSVTVKPLREHNEQTTVPQTQVAAELAKYLA